MHVTHGACVRGLGHPGAKDDFDRKLHWTADADGRGDPWVDSGWAPDGEMGADGKITWAR